VKITPEQAMEAVEAILKATNWEFESRAKPRSVLAGYEIDKSHQALLGIAMDDDRGSVIFGSSYVFKSPRHLHSRIRNFLIDEADILYGANIQFSPTQGVHINTRCWLPNLDLDSTQLQAVLEPYLRGLLKTSTYLFPRLITFLEKNDNPRSQDGFCFPS